MKTTIKTTEFNKSGCFNPFRIDGRFVKTFYITDETGNIICSTKWFANRSTNNEISKLVFNFEIPLKRKHQTNDAYMIKTDGYQDKLSWVDVYIPYHLINDFKNHGEFLNWESDTQKCFLTKYSFNAKSIIDIYSIGEDEKLKTTDSEFEYNKIYFTANYRTDNTDFGNDIESLKNELDSLEINIGSYQLEKLMKHYKLIKL